MKQASKNTSGRRGQQHKPDRSMRIADIKIGERFRKEENLGDLDGLAASMAELGLLHPVVVNHKNELVAGYRRLAAAKKLNWAEISVTVIDLDAVVRGEFAENTQRKDFTLKEAVAIKRALEPIEQVAAKERQRAGKGAEGSGGRGKKKPPGKLPEGFGRAADRAARATGQSRRTLERAEAVIDAAEADPEKFGDLAARLDEEGARVETIHREMRQRQERAAYEARIEEGCRIDDLKALVEPGRKFGVIYMDPPWDYVTFSEKGKERSADRHYDVMAAGDLDELTPVIWDLAAPNCALFLCTTWAHLPLALKVIGACGFKYSTGAFDWVKTEKDAPTELTDLKDENVHFGMGHVTRLGTEPVLLGLHGAPARLDNGVRQVVIAPVTGHSEKPEEIRRRIEQLYAGPYLELFARKREGAAPSGWTLWGNEIPRKDFAAAAPNPTELDGPKSEPGAIKIPESAHLIVTSEPARRNRHWFKLEDDGLIHCKQCYTGFKKPEEPASSPSRNFWRRLKLHAKICRKH